jgi:hypothetical protein
MWKSILYKEWLKLKWIFIIFTLVGLMAVGSIFLNVKHDILFSGATNYWYSILFMGFQYFQLLKYIPLAIGIAIGLAQYFPETVNKRIKLSFHLPVDENKLLVTMILCGTISLIVSFGLMFLLFWGLSIHFLPTEIVNAAILSVIPWFLAGFSVYYFIGLIVLEPVWKYWIFYGLVGFAFVGLFMEPSVAGAFEPINPKLLMLTVLLSISLLFSANRFRKGEM